MPDRALHAYRLLAILIFAYACLVAIAVFAYDVQARLDTSWTYVSYSLQSSLILLLGAAVFHLGKLFREKHPHPTLALLTQFRAWASTEHRAVHAVIGFSAFIAMISIFGAVKSTLPQFAPFSYDAFFFKLDRFLFFGHDPYAILLPLFGSDLALSVLSIAYQFWLLCVIASIVWVVLSANHRMRLQYLFANLIAFAIAGNLLAVLLSSAGPCYFDEVLGSAAYSPLFTHLEAADARTGMIWALDGQRMLWASHAFSQGNISGISAMPSLHNLHAWLWVFLVWKNPFARYCAIVYAMMIFIGSIVLGWHYAVDSIAGVVLAFPCWWLAKTLADRAFRNRAKSLSS
ncbi:phosphatase PAP2 family protein [Sulfitobacter aestuariivivens]|uniref:Phosphatase PAP2 family protein n=1 Tax=Sulfitobacter aestuariivivens TaxID=2766981 RepID=A0A927HFU5_9RHOB|nr:phosphatase PAP2 family protein [Sulfitobacter aestuariivivens]MBD3666217.1 phosphatase PAP2 family protein [Sulfitobacter aestuariivivens]